MTWRAEMGALHSSLQAQLQAAHVDAMVDAHLSRIAIDEAWAEQIAALDDITSPDDWTFFYDPTEGEL